jgi:hypothetical protein
MKNENIRHDTMTRGLLIAFTLACFSVLPAAQAAGRHSIVGLWSVHYVSTTGGPEAFSFDQWHSDGLEFEVAGFAPGTTCQGTYKQASNGSYHNYHVAWTFDTTGAPSGYWDENLIATVSNDGTTYSGTYARKFYDTNGNFLFEDDGTLTATRLTVER